MADKKKYDFCGAAAALFAVFVPVCGSVFDGKAVLYLFSALCLLALGIAAYEGRSLPFSKVSLFLLAASFFSLAGLFWVSDKGSQFFLAAVPAASFAFSSAVAAAAKIRGREALSLAAKTVYYSASLYAAVDVLYQFFIADKALSYRMDFGSGSSFASAALMTIGIMCARRVRRGRERSAGFIAALILMVYVLIMTGSIAGYIFAAAVLLRASLHKKKLRVEAFVCAAVLVFLSVLKIIYTIGKAALLKEHFAAALYGIGSVFGRGCGGYNAAFGILGKAYDTSPPGILFLCEVGGVFGLAGAVCAVIYAMRKYFAKPKISNFVALALLCGLIFSSSEQMIYALPLLAAYYMLGEDGVNVRAGTVLSWIFVPLGAFFIYLSVSRVPFALGKSALENEAYASAAEYCEMGARMEMFSSEGWEKAYEALKKAGGSAEEKKFCLEKAEKFNPEKLEYAKERAEVFSSEKSYAAALAIWEEIIEKCDSEYLYPEYAEKIFDAMEHGTSDAEREKELYERLLLCAEKCTDDEVKRAVNDILARAQRFYVVSLEGGEPAGDMYNEAVTEEPSVGETEAE